MKFVPRPPLGPGLVPRGGSPTTSEGPERVYTKHVARRRSAGLWKTVNRGTSFTPILDDGRRSTVLCRVDPRLEDGWLGTARITASAARHCGAVSTAIWPAPVEEVGLAVRAHRPRSSSIAQSDVVYVAAQCPLSRRGERGCTRPPRRCDVDAVALDRGTPASRSRARSCDPDLLRVGDQRRLTSASDRRGEKLGS